jgi:hypothetical protein
MKVCPKCGKTFDDDSLRFCLADGTQLRDPGPAPTVELSQPSVITSVTPRAKKKSGIIKWLVAAALLLIVGGIIVAALVAYAYHLGQQTSKNAPQVRVSPSASPRASTGDTPRPSPSSTPNAAESNDTAVSDEVTPISWTTAAVAFKQETGMIYHFHCPEKGTAGVIWGSDVYTADSSICTAAVHAGVITLDAGGDVTIEFKPGRAVYGSTVRNGITSNNYGEYPHSFVVR